VALPRLLEEFVLRAPFETSKNVLAPIQEAIDHCPDEVHSIIEGIVLAEDREPHTQQLPQPADVVTIMRVEAYAYHAKWIAESPDKYQPLTRQRLLGWGMRTHFGK
jgi:hypothetical protein